MTWPKQNKRCIEKWLANWAGWQIAHPQIWEISRVLKKAKERSSEMKFSRIGLKEDLIIVGIGDASFKTDDKAVGGALLFFIKLQYTNTSLNQCQQIASNLHNFFELTQLSQLM